MSPLIFLVPLSLALSKRLDKLRCCLSGSFRQVRSISAGAFYDFHPHSGRAVVKSLKRCGWSRTIISIRKMPPVAIGLRGALFCCFVVMPG